MEKYKEAEKRSRDRDLENPINNAVTALVDAGFRVYRPDNIKSNVKHVQFIQENWEWINNLPKNDKQRLTTAERSFLVQLVPFIHYGTNSICRKTRTGYEPLNIMQIAEGTKIDRKMVGNLMRSLTRKGVLAESATGSDVGYSSDDPNSKLVKIKMWHVNPRLIHSGRNKSVNDTLRQIFAKSLTNAPVKLFRGIES